MPGANGPLGERYRDLDGRPASLRERHLRGPLPVLLVFDDDSITVVDERNWERTSEVPLAE